MKFLFAVAFISSTVSAATLSEVYGPVKAVSAVKSWAERKKYHPDRTYNSIIRDEEYYAVRDPEQCIFPLEVVLVQDTTSSTTDNFINMRETQLDLMIDALSQDHPNSRFGITSFRDKPIWSLGAPNADYCFAIESTISEDTGRLHTVYNRIHPIGGGDPPENQMGALLATAQSSRIGWGSNIASRLMILITDAQPHFEGDGFQKEEYNMVPFSGTWDESGQSGQCLGEYYPHPDQLVQSIIDRETYVAFIVYDGGYQHGLPSDAWKWFNSYLGQTDGFVGDLGEGSTAFWDSLAQVIREIEQVECVPRSTGQPPTSIETTSGSVELGTTFQTQETTATTKPISTTEQETSTRLVSSEEITTEIETSSSATELTTTENVTPSLEVDSTTVGTIETVPTPAETASTSFETDVTTAETLSTTTESTTESLATSAETEVTTFENTTTSGETEATTAEPESTSGETEATTVEPESTSGETEVTTVESESTSGETESTTIESESTTFEVESTSVEAESTSGEAEVTTVEGESTSGETEVTTVEGESTSGETEVTTFEGESTSGETEVTTVEGESTSAETEVPTVEGESTSIETEASTFENASMSSEPEVTTEGNESTSLESSDTTTEAEATSGETELSSGSFNSESTTSEDASASAESTIFTSGTTLAEDVTSSEEYGATHTDSETWTEAV